jgi:hypothetical protein
MCLVSTSIVITTLVATVFYPRISLFGSFLTILLVPMFSVYVHVSMLSSKKSRYLLSLFMHNVVQRGTLQKKLKVEQNRSVFPNRVSWKTAIRSITQLMPSYAMIFSKSCLG